MIKTALSQELTEQYQNQTLPDGYYYFTIGGSTIQIGQYLKPKKKYCIYAAQSGLPAPSAALKGCTGLFIGALKTVLILAPVPPYQEA